MNIVVLNGNTLNPGDFSWEPFERLGNLTVYDYTAIDQLAYRLADAHIIVAAQVPWTKQALDCAPKVRMLCVMQTGCNNVDLAECARRNITVTCVPAYSTPDVAQHTFALLLELCVHAGQHSDGVLAGKWISAPDFCYWETPLMELSGKTMGIVGMGAIGSSVARIASSFGMSVVFCNRSQKPQYADAGMKQLEFEDLLAVSDVVSLHVPATPQTIGMINEAALERMKTGALLINTARGLLVDQDAVANALTVGKLAGYGADVIDGEPMRASNPLLVSYQKSLESGKKLNMVITPHIAWATREARERLFAVGAQNIECFLAGTPQNLVLPDA